LASLHQLRGRVGRDTGKGFCFVFMSTFSATAFERLKNLEEISDGMSLAEIDMKLRGQGDIFSTMQHGYKKYKIANLDNFDLLEQTKKAAEETYPQIKVYPEIKDKLANLISSAVSNN
jgi:ATP-dependent DNA helicase RecG